MNKWKNKKNIISNAGRKNPIFFHNFHKQQIFQPTVKNISYFATPKISKQESK